MTTMDSDSESQDSDEGRRFRFEATRKDSAVSRSLNNSREKKWAPGAGGPSSGSRGSSNVRDRDGRDRHREVDRCSRHEHRKRESPWVASAHGKRSSRDRSDFSRAGKDSRYSSRESPKMASNQRHSGSRECRGHESRRRCSHDRPDERGEKNSKSRERKRSRERGGGGDPSAASAARTDESARSKPVVTGCRLSSRTKIDEESTIKDATSKRARRSNEIEGKIGSGKKSNREELDCRLPQDCQELNLSDFDIVSDTEENSENSGSSTGRRVVRDDGEIDGAIGGDKWEKEPEKREYSTIERAEDRHKKRKSLKNHRKRKKLDRGDCKNGERERRNDLGENLKTSTDKEERGKIGDTRNPVASSRHSEDSNDSTYGPALPPNASPEKRDFKSLKDDNCSIVASREGEEKKAKRNSRRLIGPSLPEHFRNTDEPSEETFGPALPPHLTQRTSDCSAEEKFSPEPAARIPNEESPKNSSGSENEDFLGPLPVDHPSLENDIVQRELERRARRLKAELAAYDREDEKKNREEWMTELPPARSANLGPGPRKFRARAAPDMSDRSSWTDTPSDKARKRMEKLEKRETSEPTVRVDSERSTGNTEKSNKREKSLLEIHQKKLHKRKKKDEKDAKKMGKTTERRPFDRDVDLEANRFDEARKKSMFLKARDLDTRFSRGKI